MRLIYKRRDKAEAAMWKRGEDQCPIVQACDEGLTPLWDEESEIVRATVTRPAHDLRDVAFKLMIWRAESVLTGHRLEHQRDVPVFGAYQDVLRLAHMQASAHPLDARTLAKAMHRDGQ